MLELKLKIFIFYILIISSKNSMASEVSFTVDDPEVSESPIYNVKERNDKILEAFSKYNIQSALFVCGKRIDNPEGKILLETWNKSGHLIANHSYSHHYYNSKNISFETYLEDFLKVEPLISKYKNFTRLYRFPYLKEGDSTEKRDQMRLALEKNNYRQGHVTIDASDWYIDSRLRERLKIDPKTDLKPYKDFYLKHMWNRSIFYSNLAKKVYRREIKHTILIHHNLLNALFLKDLIQMFKNNGWKIISAKEAFNDSIYQLQPNIIPAGESIVWASAKETGKFENILRYPAEDGKYEKTEMDELGL